MKIESDGWGLAVLIKELADEVERESIRGVRADHDYLADVAKALRAFCEYLPTDSSDQWVFKPRLTVSEICTLGTLLQAAAQRAAEDHDDRSVVLADLSGQVSGYLQSVREADL